MTAALVIVSLVAAGLVAAVVLLVRALEGKHALATEVGELRGARAVDARKLVEANAAVAEITKERDFQLERANKNEKETVNEAPAADPAAPLPGFSSLSKID